MNNKITDEKIRGVCGGISQFSINKKRCTACGMCEITCSESAIKLVNNLATIDYNLCTLCGKCANACPTGAISVQEVTPAR